ncbi:MAG: cupin domain-containing protein [Henriciella sp.]|nr:cupin domain-containing protein [Henriciella sp.]
MNSDVYHAFMLDYTAGSLSPDMAVAAELHVLLNQGARQAADIWHATANAMAKRTDERVFLPEALELATTDAATIPWKRGLSGVHYAKRGKGKGQLMRLDAGQSAPEHSHSVLEATVVLSGEFADGHGIYSRGDLVLGRPGMRHRPAAHGDQTCMCYVAKGRLPFWRFS